jgi:hypothetical protein
MGSELVLAEKVSSGVTVASAESEGVREWRSEHPPPPPASWLTSFERKVCETKNREYIFVLPVSEKIATLRKKKIFLYPHFFLWEEQGCNVHVQYMYSTCTPTMAPLNNSGLFHH